MGIHKSLKYIGSILQAFPLCRTACLRYTTSTLWLVFFLLPFHQYYYYRFTLTQWDLLLFTGILAFILGLSLMADLHKRFETTLQRLIARRVIPLEQEKIQPFLNRVEENADYWSRIFGIISAISMFAAFTYVLLQDFFWQRVLLAIFETFCAYVTGTFIGQMAGYGQLGRLLEKEAIEIQLQPAHVDGVAGLKPIGDFIFHQAMITSIPALYLASWWFLFPIWPRDYSLWEDAYLALLCLAIFFEIMAFILPILLFHKTMIREKENWLKKADSLSNTIAESQQILALDGQQQHPLLSSDEIENLKRRYWEIENMATWPVDVSIKKKFRFNNFLLFIPLVGDIAKRSVDWSHLKPILERIFHSGI